MPFSLEICQKGNVLLRSSDVVTTKLLIYPQNCNGVGHGYQFHSVKGFATNSCITQSAFLLVVFEPKYYFFTSWEIVFENILN